MSNTVESKAYLEPPEIYELACNKGEAKAQAHLKYLLCVGF